MILGKKGMVVLVHENHDKWPNGSPLFNIFAVVLTTQICKFFPMFKFLPKITFSNVYFSKYEHKTFVRKDDIMLPPIRLGIGHIFRNGGDRCLL